MSAFHNCLRVNARRAAIRTMRKRNQKSLIVNGFQNALEWNGKSARRSNNFYVSAKLFLGFPDILHGRKILVGCDYFIATRGIEIKTGSDGGKRDGCVWLDLNGARCAAEYARNTVADSLGEFPPACGPRIFARVIFPRIAVSQHRFACCSRHRTQAMTEQMNAGVQGGKFITMPVDRFGCHVFVCCRIPSEEEQKSLVLYHLTFFICHLRHTHGPLLDR